MLICPRCANHLKPGTVTCPLCGSPAPARANPALAQHVQASALEEEVAQDFDPASLLPRRYLPDLESYQAWKAAKRGFLIGVVFPLVCCGLASWPVEHLGGWLPCLFLIPAGFGAFIAFCFWATVLFWEGSIDLRNRLLGREPTARMLDRVDALAPGEDFNPAADEYEEASDAPQTEGLFRPAPRQENRSTDIQSDSASRSPTRRSGEDGEAGEQITR